MCVDLGHRELGIGFALALELALARGFHALPQRSAAFAIGLLQQVLLRHGGHLDLDVDAVEQGAGNLAAIARHLVRRTAAFAVVVAEVAAGAGIHRRDELELGLEIGAPRRARDGDASALQRFAQHFQYAAVELGQLVEEQHAMHGDRDLAGARVAAATHQCHGGSRMVR